MVVDLARALQGPLGYVPLLPTSGMGTESVPQFLDEHNVLSVGASRQIVRPDAVRRGNWDEATRHARHWTNMEVQTV